MEARDRFDFTHSNEPHQLSRSTLGRTADSTRYYCKEATGLNRIPLSGSQPLEFQPPPPPQQQQQQHGGRSASDLLRLYIDRFDQTESGSRPSGLPQSPTLAPTATWDKARPTPHHRRLPPHQMEDDWDTRELLCGGASGDECFTSAAVGAAPGQQVSVRTRRILNDVDRNLGHCQPCYSAPDKLDLRTMWPSMHEHLERRWRRQLRARYEAQLREEAAASAAAKASQGSRADLYSWSQGSRRHHQLSTAQQARTWKARIETDSDGDDDDVSEKVQQTGVVRSKYDGDAGEPESDDGGDVGNVAGGGGAGAGGSTSGTARSQVAAEDEEEEDEGGRPWGSDSGVGLSCIGAGAGEPVGERLPPREKLDEVADAAVDYKDEEAEEAQRSFEERMRSYRCVLEAHELSAQLRQHLEVACATAGGPRTLTADQKGRIRDRLARLQHPELAPTLPEAGTDIEARHHAEQEEQQQQQQRITTERLARLMSSARGLLTDSDERLASCQRLCDDFSVSGGRQQQQEQQQ